jgi:hypothetical protein
MIVGGGSVTYYLKTIEYDDGQKPSELDREMLFKIEQCPRCGRKLVKDEH